MRVCGFEPLCISLRRFRPDFYNMALQHDEGCNTGHTARPVMQQLHCSLNITGLGSSSETGKCIHLTWSMKAVVMQHAVVGLPG